VTTTTLEAAPTRSLRPGSAAFTVVMSLAMAMTALAIDSMLPAFDSIRDQLGLDPDATDVAVLVTAFIIGLGLGQLPAGLLADRFGRRPVLWGGVVIYIVGAVGTALAPSLATMALARFVWGLGAAGPRVAVTAMIRDAFQGEEMARQMSNIMAIFLLVPMVAPSAGAAMVALGSWRYSVWMCVAVGAVVFALSMRLPATLPPEQRRALNVREIGASWRIVFTTPGMIAFLAAITFANSVFLSYLASSENLFDTVFGLGDWFPIIFGAMAVGLAVGAIANGRVVRRVGLDRMLARTSGAFVVASALMLVVALLTDGVPPFALFAPLMLAALMTVQVTTINANTAAMVPLGHVAGSGAALLGMVPMVVGSLIGSLIDRQFDGTVTPLATAFLIAALLAYFSIRIATSRSRAAISGGGTGHSTPREKSGGSGHWISEKTPLA
jgi:DHA1 family bicyclomycin/chloramphenicol resistance-like MFS transporter